MNRRERVRATLRFEVTDQVVKDLGGMASTGISCFAYPKLVEALGLPPRRPKIFDLGQMLAVPDEDVLDALDCDVCFVSGDAYTNAFEEPERWKPYDFNGRLPALVYDPDAYEVLADGTVRRGGTLMPPSSYVFTSLHAGQPLDLSAEPERCDLEALAKSLENQLPSAERVEAIAAYCRRAREATDRAIMFNGIRAPFGFAGGIASFSMLCMLDPEHVKARHQLLADFAVKQAELLAPAIEPYVDVLMLSANDLGTQNASILPPELFVELFVPYYRQVNDACHRVAPELFTFLHSCGAIHDLLDGVVDAGFDAVNPIQWCAGGHSAAEWKEHCRGRLAMWGGGVDTQHTLPLGTVEDVRREVEEVVSVLAEDSGFVFCAIHNLLAEIAPEKIIAMYETAASVRVRQT